MLPKSAAPRLIRLIHIFLHTYNILWWGSALYPRCCGRTHECNYTRVMLSTIQNPLTAPHFYRLPACSRSANSRASTLMVTIARDRFRANATTKWEVGEEGKRAEVCPRYMAAGKLTRWEVFAEGREISRARRAPPSVASTS